MPVEREHTALQAHPQGEPRQHFEEDAAQRPDIEDEGHLGKVLHPHIGLIREALGEEGMNLGWQVLGRRLDELTLILNCTAFFVEEEGGTEVDDFESSDRLRLLLVLDDNVIRFQVTVHD